MLPPSHETAAPRLCPHMCMCTSIHLPGRCHIRRWSPTSAPWSWPWLPLPRGWGPPEPSRRPRRGSGAPGSRSRGAWVSRPWGPSPSRSASRGCSASSCCSATPRSPFRSTRRARCPRRWCSVPQPPPRVPVGTAQPSSPGRKKTGPRVRAGLRAGGRACPPPRGRQAARGVLQGATPQKRALNSMPHVRGSLRKPVRLLKSMPPTMTSSSVMLRPNAATS